MLTVWVLWVEVLFHLGQRQKILLISVVLVRPEKYFAKVTLTDKASGLFLVILWYEQLEEGTDKPLF